MQHPFELAPKALGSRLDEMVDVTFKDLQSQFLVLPKKASFIEFDEFQAAYEVLKRHMKGFSNLSEPAAWAALKEDALTLVILRTVLGMSPGEWAEIARQERDTDVSTTFARSIDVSVRKKRDTFQRLPVGSLKEKRVKALLSTALEYIYRGAPPGTEDTVHRLAKADTSRVRPRSGTSPRSTFPMRSCCTSATSGARSQATATPSPNSLATSWRPRSRSASGARESHFERRAKRSESPASPRRPTSSSQQSCRRPSSSRPRSRATTARLATRWRASCGSRASAINDSARAATALRLWLASMVAGSASAVRT